ncbi:MAG: hypothetical protein ACRCUE_16820 [Bosea sp. (in: a-proteobacteria)]
MGLVTPLRQLKSLAAIERTHTALGVLLADITNTLSSNVNAQNYVGNDADTCWRIPSITVAYLI